MRRFVEANPGLAFSFWYPSAWRVDRALFIDPSRNAWFPGATIVKVLKIHNPTFAVGGDQLPGVVLEEITAPSGLTELGHSASASPVGMDGKYSYDRIRAQWMYVELPAVSDTTPCLATILQRTMGGLPMFAGAARHDAEVIVPLDPSHFLAITTMDVGSDDSHIYLASTVVAAHPNGRSIASWQEQAETIRREGLKLRAFGERLEAR
jgi:hypothetical protein